MTLKAASRAWWYPRFCALRVAMDGLSTAELKKALASRESACRELHRELVPRIYSQMALPAMGSESLAEDMAHAVFVALVRSAEKPEREPEELFPNTGDVDRDDLALWRWTWGIAKNKRDEYWRKVGRESRGLATFAGELGSKVVDQPLDEHARQQVAREAVGQLVGALESESPGAAEVLRQRWLTDPDPPTPHAQCADRMGIATDNFRQQHKRAVDALKDIVERDGLQHLLEGSNV